MFCSGDQAQVGGSMLEKTELLKLQSFLCDTLGNDGLRVTLDPKDEDRALVGLGERTIASVALDDEDGDRSFSFSMKIPVGRAVLQDYLIQLFENDSFKIVGRPNKTDSVELNSGSDFLGVVSADDAKASSYTLQIAILDFDLEDY